MAGRNIRGFTIIEVMLFLSISGVLFVALMIGVNTNINQQRYRDSVTSFAALLQQQYSEVSNTRNDRDGTWKCESSIISQDPVDGQARGTSECVLLGRYIRTIDNGTKVELGNVIGTVPSTTTLVDSDRAALGIYAPRASEFDRATYAPEWGATLKNTDDDPANFTIIILRSPLSGLIRAFAVNGGMPADLMTMMQPEDARRKITTCVVSDNLLIGPTQAVVLDAATAGPNGITTLGDDSQC